jgi:hypothetical protein
MSASSKITQFRVIIATNYLALTSCVIVSYAVGRVRENSLLFQGVTSAL